MTDTTAEESASTQRLLYALYALVVVGFTAIAWGVLSSDEISLTIGEGIPGHVAVAIIGGLVLIGAAVAVWYVRRTVSTDSDHSESTADADNVSTLNGVDHDEATASGDPGTSVVDGRDTGVRDGTEPDGFDATDDGLSPVEAESGVVGDHDDPAPSEAGTRGGSQGN
jgi:uncharacterized membrane protein